MSIRRTYNLIPATMLLLLGLLFQQISYAQASAWQWIQPQGGAANDYGKSVARDKDGNIYVLAEYNGSITMGASTFTSRGLNDILLIKYTASGKLLWSKSMGSTGNDLASQVFVDSLGYVYIAGTFPGADFNYGTGILTNTFSGNVEIFFIRLNSDGQVLWAKNPSGPGDDYAGRIYSNGPSVLLTGYFQSAGLDFGSGISVLNNGYRPGFIVNYDSAGTALWANRYGGGNTDMLVAPSMDKNGSIFIAGNVGSNTLSFGAITIPGPAAAGQYDIFIGKFSGTGVAQWVKVITGVGAFDEVMDMESDSDGNTYITGYFKSTTLNFGTQTLSNPTGIEQVFIARYDSLGNLKWARKSATDVLSRGTDISIRNQREIYFSGYYSGGSIQFDQTLTNSGSFDGYITAYDSSGTALLSQKIAGTGDDRAMSLSAHACGVIATGYFRSPVLSVASLTANNVNGTAYDIFTASYADPFTYNVLPDTLRVCGDDIVLDAGTGMNSYLWNTTETSQSITADMVGRYKVNVFNSLGCYGSDSVYVSIVKSDIINHDTIICKGGAPFQLAIDSSKFNGVFFYSFNKNMNLNWGPIYFSTIPAARVRMRVSGNWAPLNWAVERLDAGFQYRKTDNVLIRPWMVPTDNPAPFLVSGSPLRPSPDVYNPLHIYDYYFTTPGTSFDLAFNELVTGDNSGNLAFELYAMNNPVTVQWSTGASTNTIEVNPQVTTKYYVTVTDGITVCKDSVLVTVLDAPVITLQDTIKICSDSVELDAGPGADSYQWSNGASTQKTKVYTGGKFYVTAKNSIGCERVDSVFVSMFRSDILQNDTAICRNSLLNLQAQTKPGFTYAWSTGATTPSINITPAVDTRIYLQTSNGLFTCTDSVQVNTLALPVLVLPDTVKVCGTSTTLDAGTGFASYQWSNGANTQTITVTTSGKYYIDVTNAATCGTRDSIYVSLINAVVTQDDTAICKGNTLSLNALNIPGYTYSWSNGAVGTSTTVTPLVNTKYYLTATDGIGSCQDSVQVDVLALPVTAILDTIKVCGVSATIDAGNGFASYQWSTGATTQIITATTSGKYFVTVTNAATCAVQDSVYVSIVRSDILQGDTTICKGSSLVLPAYTQGLNTYSWSTGQTGSSIVVNPVNNTKYYLHTSDGIQTCTDSVLVQLHVINTAVAAQSATTFCAGGSVTLKAAAGYSYQWKKDGILMPGATAADLVATQSGNYKVIITNAAGCIDSSLATTVSVQPLPTATVSPSTPIVICEGSSRVLTAVVNPNATGVTQYQWLLNAAPITGASNTVFSVSTAGSYSVMVTNSNGCVANATPVVVTVSPKPVITITNTLPVSICAGASQTLQATIDAGTSTIVSRQWYRNGALIAGATGTSYLVTQGGQYKLEAINANGCVGSSVLVNVVESALPVPTIVAPAVSKICRGVYATITATGGLTYEWYLNGVLIAGASSASFNAVDPGTYTVKAINAAGCSAMAPGSVVLTVIEPPKADFTVLAKCAGAATVFTNLSVVAPTDVVNYTWSTGDGSSYTSVDAIHNYSRGGNYTVTLSAASSACAFAPSVKSVIVPIEQARAGIQYPALNAVAGKPLDLQARTFGQTYQWTPSIGLSNTTIAAPKATLYGPQTYRVQIGTASGCVTVDTVLVRIFSKGDIFVPTGFTPNNDGKNDRLYPILAGMSSLNYFRVFNRWGNLIFETRSSDAASGWNGVYNGQLQPTDTYIWTAEGIDVDGNKIIRKGTVVLIR